MNLNLFFISKIYIYLFYINIYENKNEIINPGGISFSLPCEAVLNRGIKNELKRIKIEIQNKKLLNLYENPVDTISTYKEKNE